MKVGDYSLVNDEKIQRAIEGTPLSKGGKMGGVGRDASDEQLLVEYDRLGGLIRKDGMKVKAGCFYDFDEKKAVESPEPIFEVSIDSSLVEVSEAEATALESAKKKREALKSEAKGKDKAKPLRRKKKVEETKA